MKIKKEVDFNLCDNCNDPKKDAYSKCFYCKKDFCWDCGDKLCIRYPDSIYCYSREGFYCKACDKLLTENNKLNLLHSLYKKVEKLKEDSTNYHKSEKSQVEALTDNIARLYKTRL